MNPAVPKWIWYSGMTWGLLWLPFGAAVSFTIGANDTNLSILSFVILFLSPITAGIAARWKPMISGLALLTVFCVTLIVIASRYGLRDVGEALARPLLWPYLFFGVAYLVSAAVARSADSRYDSA